MTQTLSFSSWGKGELSPINRGHIDMEHYYTSAQSLQNMIVRPYAIPVRRSGTKYKATVKDSTKITRLLPFIVSVEQSNLIEMGEEYFRIKDINGDPLTYDLDTVDAWADTTDYVGGDVVKITSVGTFICFKDHTSEYTTNRPLTGSDYADYWYMWTADYSGTWTVEITHPYSEDELWDVDYAQKDDTVFTTHQSHDVGEIRRYSATKWAFIQGQLSPPPWLDLNTDKTHTLNINDKDVGSRTLTANFDFFATDGSDIGRYVRKGKLNAADSDSEDEQGYCKITAVASATSATVQVLVEMDDANATTRFSKDAFYTDNYPAHVTLFEGRLVFSNTPLEPQRIWLSRTRIIRDFNTSDTDDGAFTMELNTEQSNDIKWVSAGESLASGTFGGEFVSRSPSDGAMNNTNKNARRQSGWGSEFVRPKHVDNRMYFVQRGSRKLREFFYTWDSDNYSASDMTKYAEHITSSGLVDMDYQRNQDSLLWCVREDGRMAILSRQPEEEIQAWTPWITGKEGDYGYVKSVIFLPNPDGLTDRGWLIVERTVDEATVKYIEYFDNHVVEDDTEWADMLYLDCSIVADVTLASDAEVAATVGNDLTITDGPDLDAYIAATLGDDVVVFMASPSHYFLNATTYTFVSDDITKTIVFIDTGGNTIMEFTVNSIAPGGVAGCTLTGGTYQRDGTYTGGTWGFLTDTITAVATSYLLESTANHFAIGNIGDEVYIIDASGAIVFQLEIITYTDEKNVAVKYVGGTLPEPWLTILLGWGGGEIPVDGGLWGLDSDAITPAGALTTNLTPLEGKEVSVLGDGEYLGEFTITGGVLPQYILDAYTDVTVGLPIESYVTTNPLNSQTPTGMAKGHIRDINTISLELYRSLGVEYSSDGTNWFAVGLPEGNTATTTLFSGIIPNLTYDGDADYDGKIYLRQVKPYPFNLLGIYPELKINY